MRITIHRACLLILTTFSLIACGGGGGSDSSSGGNSSGGGSDGSAYTYATDYQASGTTKIKEENGVAVTSAGVQVFGKSTVDDITTTSGMTVSSGGLAQVRVTKNSEGIVSKLALLLSDIGIKWNAVDERPLIIETFGSTQGRTEMADDGSLVEMTLPDPTNISFYDYATKAKSATKEHYANNRYFPRSTASRCDTSTCPTEEVITSESTKGDWRAGGTTPDYAQEIRLHEDGDIHAGNAADGGILEGGSGVGVPFPGSKGYRSADTWGFLYSNLTAWLSQDTVDIAEWVTQSGTAEHNQNRRGIVAFGAPTDPASVPSGGTATYSGNVYGWYAASSTAEPVFFRGAASITLNFATRRATVSIQDTVSGSDSVPVTFDLTLAMNAAGTDSANYFNGAVSTSAWTGGMGAKYFGPISTSSGSSGPAELAGAFSLKAAGGSGAAVVAGFISRKQ